MWGVLRAEWGKYRWTATPWLIVGGPLTLILAAGLPRALVGFGLNWEQFLAIVFNWWPIIWLPFGLAILAGQSAAIERRAGAWRSLRVRPIPPAAFFMGKFAALAAQTLLGTLWLLALTLAGGLFLTHQTPPFGQLLTVGALLWVVALPLIALALWLALAGGFVATLLGALVGVALGALTAEGSRWFLVPTAWPLRLALPLVGVHANGVPLEPDSPLRQISTLPPLVAALVATVILLGLGQWWFTRREVH